jgi:RHS repeat-associated protein
VCAVTDSTGKIVEAYEYDPYGRHVLLRDGPNATGGDQDTAVNFNSTDIRLAMGASAIGNPYTFTGQRFDPETGLHHYKERYYSSSQGRFISRDPMGYRGGLNLQSYAGNRPTNRIDPNGLTGRPARYYTCNCGWINSDHAEANIVRNLITDVREKKGRRSLTGNGSWVSYEQDMVMPTEAFLGGGTAPIFGNEIRVSYGRAYFVSDDLQGKELEVALGIFMEVSEGFEKLQGSFPYRWFSGDSSFAEGDLVSDLIAFYIKAGLVTKELLFETPQPNGQIGLCGVLDEAQSAEVLRMQGGSLGKSRSWTPMFRKTPKDACCRKPTFPGKLQTLTAAPYGELWRKWRVVYEIAYKQGRDDEINPHGPQPPRE